MQSAQIPLMGFAAYSGSGKTTLLTSLLPCFKQQGLRVALIKHSHHAFEIDQPGKDSFRLREAGADTVLLVSAYRRAIISEFPDAAEPELAAQLDALAHLDLDLVLVEGFRQAGIPKIAVHRPSLNKPLLYPEDAHIVAVASDTPLTLAAPLVSLDLNQAPQIAQFILSYLHLN